MKLETDRLEIIPLTARELGLWINDIQKLENELNCLYKAEPMEGFFLEIVKSQYTKTLEDAENYFWHSFWFLVRKSDRIVVGSADFKDIPDKNGEVEIGYGLGKEYEHNGYMTEAVKAMCRWALNENDVSAVIAETDLDNEASHSILKHSGFKKYSQKETIWWKLSE